MIPNQFNNVFFPSDVNGTGFWRGTMPIQTCWTMGPQTGVSNSVLCKPTTDQNFYRGLNMFMVQRLVNQQQEQMFMNMIAPYSDAFSFWTVYNIDDAMGDDEIPHYNRGRKAFANAQVQAGIKRMLNRADFVLTTTDHIKEYYHNHYEVPLENIICIPNLLPRWWIGSFFNPQFAVENWRKHQKKPRVGVISSLSHYNIDHVLEDKDNVVVNEIKNQDGTSKWVNEKGVEVKREDCHEAKDDLDLLLPTIEKTVDQVQWVFFGYAPPQLKKYIEEKKIEVYPGISIMNYPARLNSLHLNAIVAPVVDMEFNRCKSNIKWLEACAIGVPLYAQKINTYSNYMPESQLFADDRELTAKIEKLKFQSASVFEDKIMQQWRWLNSPAVECGWKLKNWWLEDNMEPWMKLFKMRHKSQTLSLAKYIEAKKQREEQAKTEPVLIDPESGIEIIK